MGVLLHDATHEDEGFMDLFFEQSNRGSYSRAAAYPCNPRSPGGSAHRVTQLSLAVSSLSPTELKDFLSNMYNSMSLHAKEASTEIMWRTLSQREQILFDFPRRQIAGVSASRPWNASAPSGSGVSGYANGNNAWSESDILRGLSTQRPTSASSIAQPASRDPRLNVTAASRGVGPARSVVSTGTSTQLTSTSPTARLSMQTFADVNISPVSSFPTLVAGSQNGAISISSVRTGGSASSTAGTGDDIQGRLSSESLVPPRRRNLEDQIFNVLITAIERAERAATYSSTVMETLAGNTANQGSSSRAQASESRTVEDVDMDDEGNVTMPTRSRSYM